MDIQTFIQNFRGGIRREGRTASCILVFGHAGRNGGKNKMAVSLKV